VGQRTFETRSLYLILAEKLFTLPVANGMLPLSALFQASTDMSARAQVSGTELDRLVGMPQRVSQYRSRQTCATQRLASSRCNAIES